MHARMKLTRRPTDRPTGTAGNSKQGMDSYLRACMREWLDRPEWHGTSMFLTGLTNNIFTGEVELKEIGTGKLSVVSIQIQKLFLARPLFILTRPEKRIGPKQAVHTALQELSVVLLLSAEFCHLRERTQPLVRRNFALDESTPPHRIQVRFNAEAIQSSFPPCIHRHVQTNLQLGIVPECRREKPKVQGVPIAIISGSSSRRSIAHNDLFGIQSAAELLLLLCFVQSTATSGSRTRAIR